MPYKQKNRKEKKQEKEKFILSTKQKKNQPGCGLLKALGI